MNTFGFMVALNNYMGFKFDGPDKIIGDINGICFDIGFDAVGTLKAHSVIQLFGDIPYRDHIEAAYSKLKSFRNFILADKDLEMFVEPQELTDELAFGISEDINAFAKELSALGYKSDEAQKEVLQKIEEERAAREAAITYPEVFGDDVKDVEPDTPLPKRMGLGILGALIGAVVSLGLWLVASALNMLWPFIIGAIVVCFLPFLLYSAMSKQPISAVQIAFCLFLSAFTLLVGHRLGWTINLMSFYDDVTFSMCYWEVPYLVEDGIYQAFDFYQDYAIMFGPLLLFYVVIFKRFFSGNSAYRR